MGWMNDTLGYMHHEPIHRKYHHDELTFSLIYAFHENFVLPLSHDEVVHCKRSLLDQMPGDLWQKFANLRLLYSYLWTHPGKKLLFMGCEFGQWNEWNFDESLQWHLLQWDSHRGLQKCVADLNGLLRREKALYEVDFDYHGFQWIDCHNHEDSTLSYIRAAKNPSDFLVVCCNFTPVPRYRHRLGVPEAGLVRGNLQQRLGLLHRQQHGQWPGRAGRALGEPRPAGLDRRDAAAAGHGGLQAAAVRTDTVVRIARPRLPAAAGGKAKRSTRAASVVPVLTLEGRVRQVGHGRARADPLSNCLRPLGWRGALPERRLPCQRTKRKNLTGYLQLEGRMRFDAADQLGGHPQIAVIAGLQDRHSRPSKNKPPQP